MKAKYAKIIREGILQSRRDAEIVNTIIQYNLPFRVIANVVGLVASSTPKHPLALRAYVHDIEGQASLIQRKTRKHSRTPFVGKPPAPQPTKTAPKIAEGFHD